MFSWESRKLSKDLRIIYSGVIKYFNVVGVGGLLYRVTHPKINSDSTTVTSAINQSSFILLKIKILAYKRRSYVVYFCGGIFGDQRERALYQISIYKCNLREDTGIPFEKVHRLTESF